MDAFRLLSRSTSLQKNWRSNESKSQLPSSGARVEPQALTAPQPTAQELTLERLSKKRKRKIGVADTVPENGDSHRDTETVGAEIGQDERRRILKKHKLKVTLLDQESRNEPKNLHGARSGRSKNHKMDSVYPRPLQAFAELRSRYHVSQRLMGNLQEQGFYVPTEVQMAALPMLLGDEAERGMVPTRTQSNLQPDLLTIAPTGSGKTLAFLIPVAQSLLNIEHALKLQEEEMSRYVKAIVLAPTHELVDQIVNEGKKLFAGTGIKISAMRKGSHIAQASVESAQDNQTIIKTDVLVSTPMMVVNNIQRENEGHAALTSILHLVLDEADVLLDPLFREQTLAVWTACGNRALRVSLWSATIGASIESLAQEFIASRRRNIGIKGYEPIIRLIVGLKDSSLPTIAHRLTYAATEHGKLLALRELLHPSTATPADGAQALRPPFLVFTQTIQRAKALYSELMYDIPPEAGGSQRLAVLHSDLSDAARSSVMTGFRKGEVWVIITTDLLSRGMDFRGVNGVVNYDIPNTGAAYVHRAGRTGRAGREGGIAVTLYTAEDIPYIKNIANVIAASERANGKSQAQTQPAMESWLLDSLPRVGKQARKDLKRRGVAARRTTQQGDDKSREVRKARISTRSGFDRRMNDRRRGTRQTQDRAEPQGNDDSAKDDEWEGLGE